MSVTSIPNGGGSITLLLSLLSNNPAGRLEDSDCCEASNSCGSSEIDVIGSLTANVHAGPLDKAINSTATAAPNVRRDAPRADSIGADSWGDMNARTAAIDRRLMMSGYNPYLTKDGVMVASISFCFGSCCF